MYYGKLKYQISFIISGLMVLFFIAGCGHDLGDLLNPIFHGGIQNDRFRQTNLVADTSSFKAARIDNNLVNAWGIAVSPTKIFWISANHTSLSVVYDNQGNQKLNPVSIPTVNNASGGAPTGDVFNYTEDFKLPDGNPSSFIFVGEDGIVSAWGKTSGSSAVVVADESAQEAVYKGTDIAQFKGQNFLYAANFKQSKIDVFDKDFKPVTTMSFKDPAIPGDYGPFNIKNIGGRLLVTYAKHKAPNNGDDEAGPGNGYVDLYTPGGNLIARFATRGNLNSPWGIAVATEKMGIASGSVLIGNFGDGKINVFNPVGTFLGQLKDNNGNVIKIDGLWALYTFDANTVKNLRMSDPDTDKIYFTAGPNEENHGLFGYLLAK